MVPTITAFANSPDEGRGLARDMGVRWALEETGQDYDVRLLTFAELKQPAHIKLHPFGQIPTFEDGTRSMFETGAIVLHIAQSHSGLLPADAAARATAISWMFAALASVEPVIVEYDMLPHLEGDRPWFADRRELVALRVRRQLSLLAAQLESKTWLNHAFSAGDLLMVMVLRRLVGTGLLEEQDLLASYIGRGESRPAFQRAFAAQLAVFQSANPG